MRQLNSVLILTENRKKVGPTALGQNVEIVATKKQTVSRYCLQKEHIKVRLKRYQPHIIILVKKYV